MLAPTRDIEPAPRRDEEEIALQALNFIAWRSHELEAFLFSTGLTAATVRQAAKTPQFLAGVLDYVVSEPDVLRGAAKALRLPEAAIHNARHRLLPSASVTPVMFGPGPLRQRCTHCEREKLLDRRRWSHIPGPVATIEVPRCGPGGGGFDVGETWLDVEGREVGPA